MEFPKSKFAFVVKSTNARPPKTTEPELTIVASIRGKYKMNEAASKLLNVKPGDYLTFINNEEQVNQMKEAYAAQDPEVVEMVDAEGGLDSLTVQWAIAKGWALLDSNDVAIMTKKPLTKGEQKKLIAEGHVDEEGKAIAPEIQDHKGSRLSSKMKEVKSGMILEGTDSNNAPVLREGYPDDKHVVYSIEKEPVAVEFPNGTGTVDANVYLINFKGTEDKIEKSK